VRNATGSGCGCSLQIEAWQLHTVGNPLAVNATVLANPFNRWIVIVLVPLRAPGHSQASRTRGEREVWSRWSLNCERNGCCARQSPAVPVTVTVAAPKVAVVEAVSVRTLLVPVVVVVCGFEASSHAGWQARSGESYRTGKFVQARDGDRASAVSAAIHC